MERKKICGCIGYGPEHLPWQEMEHSARCKQFKCRLRQAVDQAIADGYTFFLCGMNRGTETYFAEIVLSMRSDNSAIKLAMLLPSFDYSGGWAAADRDRHRLILSACDRVVFDATPTGDYEKSDLICKRHILQLSDRLVAVSDHLPVPVTEQVLLEAAGAGNTAEIVSLPPIERVGLEVLF